MTLPDVKCPLCEGTMRWEPSGGSSCPICEAAWEKEHNRVVRGMEHLSARWAREDAEEEQKQVSMFAAEPSKPRRTRKVRPSMVCLPVHNPWRHVGDTFEGEYVAVIEDAEGDPWVMWFEAETRQGLVTPAAPSLLALLENVGRGDSLEVRLERLKPRTFTVESVGTEEEGQPTPPPPARRGSFLSVVKP
jgi:hypothetical protein